MVPRRSRSFLPLSRFLSLEACGVDLRLASSPSLVEGLVVIVQACVGEHVVTSPCVEAEFPVVGVVENEGNRRVARLQQNRAEANFVRREVVDRRLTDGLGNTSSRVGSREVVANDRPEVCGGRNQDARHHNVHAVVLNHFGRVNERPRDFGNTNEVVAHELQHRVLVLNRITAGNEQLVPVHHEVNFRVGATS